MNELTQEQTEKNRYDPEKLKQAIDNIKKGIEIHEKIKHLEYKLLYQLRRDLRALDHEFWIEKELNEIKKQIANGQLNINIQQAKEKIFNEFKNEYPLIWDKAYHEYNEPRYHIINEWIVSQEWVWKKDRQKLLKEGKTLPKNDFDHKLLGFTDY